MYLRARCIAPDLASQKRRVRRVKSQFRKLNDNLRGACRREHCLTTRNVGRRFITVESGAHEGAISCATGNSIRSRLARKNEIRTDGNQMVGKSREARQTWQAPRHQHDSWSGLEFDYQTLSTIRPPRYRSGLAVTNFRRRRPTSSMRRSAMRLAAMLVGMPSSLATCRTFLTL